MDRGTRLRHGGARYLRRLVFRLSKPTRTPLVGFSFSPFFVQVAGVGTDRPGAGNERQSVISNVEDPQRVAMPQAEGPPEPEATRVDLTPRQLEILWLIARGRSNKEIALVLGISERTVKFHVAGLFKKLCAYSRTEAVVVALKTRIIHLDGES
jgi:DNA-binding CsgD family transcriptional regulator